MRGQTCLNCFVKYDESLCVKTMNTNNEANFDVLLTVHPSIILVINQLNALILVQQ